jgi:glycosyltransferase involved in cell wall biosynthesis
MTTIPDLTLVGHPFAPIGMGEHVRCSYRALRSAAVKPYLLDIYRLSVAEEAARIELEPALRSSLGAINIFHINGDEVQQALAHIPGSEGKDAYNIVYPAWELSRYPEEWARWLDQFDEVWAPSLFIQQAISSAVKRPVVHMPLACEPFLTSFLGRRYFQIPESSYAFLFFFDFRSYASRKNPQAVVECFRRLLLERPNAHTSLVIKLNGAELAPKEVAVLTELLEEFRQNVVLLDRTMTDNEVKNLIRCCDCFVSLHRSEGFGRGLSEAMYLGKPVIGTAYSGNMDFMTAENSLLVDYQTIPVPENAYPFWQNQVWAEPDLAQATAHMIRMLDDPAAGYKLGRRASIDMRMNHSYRKCGLRYMQRINDIQQGRQTTASSKKTTCNLDLLTNSG